MFVVVLLVYLVYPWRFAQALRWPWIVPKKIQLSASFVPQLFLHELLFGVIRTMCNHFHHKR